MSNVTERTIAFHELRKIVVALFEAGKALKSPFLTFSHGNVGNELIELANYLDAFVSDLEPRDVLVIRKEQEVSNVQTQSQTPEGDQA